MARKFTSIGFALAGLMLVGCVPQEKYNAVKMDRDAALERLAQADARLGVADAEAATYRRQYDALLAAGPNERARVENLTAQLSDLQREFDELNRKYEVAVNRTAAFSPLPEALDSALSAFAAQNPGLVDYDQKRGIVKFKSDVTFMSGSADLSPQAKSAIAAFSTILNSAEARGYELMVAGHTDSTPVVNAETKRKHPNNWYLSAHRAISVSDSLQSQGVKPIRIGVVGYADQRPVSTDKSANRRVEVLILPTEVQAGVAAVEGEARPAAGKAGPKPALNKDSPVERGLNK